MESTLYVSRPLLNASHLIDWAADQGFDKTLEPDDLHVTLAFSKRPVAWHRLNPILQHLHVDGGDRAVSPLGDKGAMVLHFEHPHLSDRWEELCRAGAVWDFPQYHPHVTITYDGSGVDHTRVEPFQGPLIFGPERFAPVNLNWDQSIKEIPLVAENIGVSSSKSIYRVKYRESITENTRMTDLSSLLMKNIDLILEAYNVDQKGNLVVANKRKVAEADEVFHQYFVKSMNTMFRQINEADPIMQEPNGMGLPMHGHDDLGMGGDMMGDMSPMMGQQSMDQMGHPGMGGGMGHDPMDDGMGEMGEPTGQHPMHMGHDPMDDGMGGMTGGHMGGGGMGGGMGGGLGESSDYGWLFNEDADLDVESLFELDDDEEQLDEFGMPHEDDMMQDPHDQMGGGGMDAGMGQMGGANDMGGDMGGMGGGMDDGMDLDSGMDHQGGDMGGDDGDMMTIHGTTDQGGEFEFSFDPNTLGFDDLGGDDMGGGGMGDMDDMSDMGGHEDHGHEGGEHHEPESDHSGFGHEDEDEEPMAEAAGRKPGKGRKGPRTARMSIVPADPATNHAAPFPTPQGQKQRRK